MFEEAIINSKLEANQATVSNATPSSQASVGADELMDELFHDLEAHLDDPSAVDSLALSTEVRSPADHALSLASRRHRFIHRHQSRTQLEDDLLVPYTPMDSTLALQQNAEASLSLDWIAGPEPTTSTGIGRRLLMSTACVSLVGLSMFWVGRQLRLQHAPGVAAAPPPAMALPEVPPETIAFAEYVTQSLDRIDQETKAEKLAAASPAPTVNTPAHVGLPNLPNTPKVSVASPGSKSIPNNAERVYIPVADVPLPKLKATPLAPPANTPVIAAATSTEKKAASPLAKPLPMTPPSNAGRKFLGGTNLGDQPVFMVSINGSTRHVKLGEAIDETGATFVEFDGEQSVLKQGSQLRSVTAGQSF